MTSPRLQFRRQALGSGWSILHVVWQGETVGRISRQPRTGRYCFFEGTDNDIAYTLENADLAALEQAIVRRLVLLHPVKQADRRVPSARGKSKRGRRLATPRQDDKDG